MAICVGCGLDVNGVSGLLEVQLNGGDASGIHCDNTSGLSLGIHSNPNSGITLTGNGTTGSPLQPTLIRSPDDCNSLEIRGNGLYAPCQDSNIGTSLVQLSPQGGGPGYAQCIETGPGYGYLNSNDAHSIHICNPTCCNAAGLIFVKVSDLYFQARPGLFAKAWLEVNIDDGGFSGVMEPQPIVFFQNTGSVDSFGAINLDANLFAGFSPGECHNYQFNLQVIVQTNGAGTCLADTASHLRSDGGGPKFVTRWVVSPTSCCDHIG